MPNHYVSNPEKIYTARQAETMLRKIDYYQQKYAPGQDIGVLLVQTRSFGGRCRIASEEEAIAELRKPITSDPRTIQWGLRFYTRAFIKGITDYLNSGGKELDYYMKQPSQYVLLRE